uniref:Uncharacterized protein n=1 Tax=Scleropages formosus TaxID=113540 RepID=A0A8C9RH49_SCLFO
MISYISLFNTVMCCLRSEKCSVRQFHCCANIIVYLYKPSWYNLNHRVYLYKPSWYSFNPSIPTQT